MPRSGSRWFMLVSYVATVQDKFNELLAHDFAPWLKERGFKRRDTTFRRRQGETWQIINFQRSKYSNAGVVPFTINLGVAFDLLNDAPPWRSRGWPLESECDFRQRIGELHKRKDHWWKVRPLRPIRRTVADVLSALDKGLPWLDAHTDPASFLAHALRDPSKVNGLNLASLVAVAKVIGSAEAVEAAEAEFGRWRQGKRPDR
jgi:Domain of unknown function (DUF4304)